MKRGEELTEIIVDLETYEPLKDEDVAEDERELWELPVWNK